MLTDRMKDLMLKAAKCFDEGFSPFNDEWLSENKVTLDECMALSSTIGLAVRAYARAGSKTQMELLLVGGTDGKIDSDIARASIEQGQARKKAEAAFTNAISGEAPRRGVSK